MTTSTDIETVLGTATAGDPKHYRFAVVCADGLQRHSGTWSEPEPAKRWAQRPGCCGLGEHRVVQRRAMRSLRDLSGQGWT